MRSGTCAATECAHVLRLTLIIFMRGYFMSTEQGVSSVGECLSSDINVDRERDDEDTVETSGYCEPTTTAVYKDSIIDLYDGIVNCGKWDPDYTAYVRGDIVEYNDERYILENSNWDRMVPPPLSTHWQKIVDRPKNEKDNIVNNCVSCTHRKRLDDSTGLSPRFKCEVSGKEFAMFETESGTKCEHYCHMFDVLLECKDCNYYGISKRDGAPQCFQTGIGGSDRDKGGRYNNCPFEGMTAREASRSEQHKIKVLRCFDELDDIASTVIAYRKVLNKLYVKQEGECHRVL